MTTFCFSYSGERMAIDQEPGAVAGWIGAAGAAVGAFAFTLRKWFVSWKQDDTALAQSSVQKGLIEQLHAELVRMGEQNRVLAAEVNRLQLCVIELTDQVGKLTAEKQSLRSEIASLNERNSSAGNASGVSS